VHGRAVDDGRSDEVAVRGTRRAGRSVAIVATGALAFALAACDDEVPGDPAGDSQPAPAETAPDAAGVVASCDDLAADLGAEDDASLREAARDRPMADVLADLDDLQLIASSLQTIGDDVLPAGETLTLFAPLDGALVPDDTAAGDDAAEATELPADALLRAHAAIGSHELADADGDAELELLDGSLLTAAAADGDAEVQREDRSATVLCPDLEVADGVLHVVDDVLITPTDPDAHDGAEADTEGTPGFTDDGVRDDLPERLDEDDVGTGGEGQPSSP
jgi:uncharacterized surface protein with fasciclin (FAS1) repeats